MSVGWERGRASGYHDGRSEGYRRGYVEAIAAGLLQDGIGRRNIKALYVTAGIGVPYPALDTAVIAALGGMVRELIVVSPGDPVSRLAAEHRPDWALALNGIVLPAEQVIEMRRMGIRTAIWFTDDPYYTDWTAKIAPNYDDVFTLEHSCVSFYRQLGCASVHHMPFGADPSLFFPKPADSAFRRDICFIGTAYWNRVELFDRLAPLLSRRNTIISGWWWDRLAHYEQLKQRIRLGDWLSPEETALWYSGAKLVINLHRRSDDDTINHNSRAIPAISLNPRSFEINACGALQLCDARDDLARFYTPGQEIVTYRSAEELQELIGYYLEHEEERRDIALKGFVRTFREHTYRRRLDQMLRIALGGSV